MHMKWGKNFFYTFVAQQTIKSWFLKDCRNVIVENSLNYFTCAVGHDRQQKYIVTSINSEQWAFDSIVRDLTLPERYWKISLLYLFWLYFLVKSRNNTVVQTYKHMSHIIITILIPTCKMVRLKVQWIEMMNSYFRIIVLWLMILLWCAVLSICQAIHIDIVRKPSLKFNGLKVSKIFETTCSSNLKFHSLFTRKAHRIILRNKTFFQVFKRFFKLFVIAAGRTIL